jgi:magnesium transporter
VSRRRRALLGLEAGLGHFRLASRRSRALVRHRGPKPGAYPGALALPEGAPAPEIRAVRYAPDRCEEQSIASPDALSALRVPEGEGVLWVDVRGFGDRAALERLGELFRIHPLALADAVHVPQRPKLEDFEDRHLLVTRMARLTDRRTVELEQLSLIIGPGFVITLQERPEDPVLEPVRERLRAGVGQIRRKGSDYLAYAILDAVIDGYFPVIEALGETLEDLETEVTARPRPTTLAAIHAVRRTLLVLHRVVWRQRDALNALLRDEHSPLEPSTRVYLRDALDHAVQILDAIETSRDLAIGLLELYLSTISHRTNEIMKTLTVMATIFIPLTYIVGIYGMNFDVMPELRWPWGYAFVWAVMLAVAGGLLAWFWRRGWLGDRGDSR